MQTGRPDETDRKATLWELLNAVTGYVQHTKTRHKISNSQMGIVQRALVGVNDSESVAAWELANTMAG